ncbi:MAG TPA: AsmA family protein [Xanthobacteraceae bacterium]|nr:AsmA family protein [Xanthobacteraceae bacterium]
MQNTLLGIGIALILALIAALVTPYFVNWNSHRAFFEAEATRLVGLPVQVSGAIDARLLPTPSITLRAIAIGEPGEPHRLRAGALSFQLGLGPLMRGEIKAVETRLIGPELKLGLNYDGTINWPKTAPQIRGDTVSIDRLLIEEGRAILTDAASGARLVLDKLKFRGEARSLVGPIRGEGNFLIGEAGYRYRIGTGRYGADGMRVKLEIEPFDRPLSIEADGMLAFDYGAPRFEGNVVLMRPVGAVLAGGKATVNEPWRATSKVRASVSGVLFEQIEFRYGPEERAMTLAGAAEATLGEQPRLHGDFSARHIDLDRLTAKPGSVRQLPFAAIKTFAEMFGESLKPALPTLFTLKIDSMTVGGSMLQSIHCIVRSERDGWMLDPLEFRAPGFTQVQASGRLALTEGSVGFVGSAKINAADSMTLLGWLTGRGNSAAGPLRSLQAQGEVALTRARIAVENLQTEFDRATLNGRLAYTFSKADRPATLAAEIQANEIDVDAWLQIAETAVAGLALERPQEVELAAKVDKARIAGIDARNASAKLKLNGDRIDIERLSVDALGNASFEIRGRIETADGSPRGEIDLKLDARELNGITALAEKFAPRVVDPLRSLVGEQPNVQLRGKLGMESSSPGALTKRTTARLRVDGQIGVFHLQLAGASTAATGTMSLGDFAGLAAGEMKFEAQLDTQDDTALLALIGLDRVQVAKKGPGRLKLVASGPLNREFRIDARLIAGPIHLTGVGTASLFGEQPPGIKFGHAFGAIGNSKVEGRITLAFESPLRIEGVVAADRIDVREAVAAMIGMPIERMTTLEAGTASWSLEPFPPVLFSLTGRVEVRAVRATLSAQQTVRALRGALQFTSSRASFEIVDGELAGGRIKGNIAIFSGLDGLSALTYLELNNARAADVIPTQGRAPISGDLSLKATVEGTGLTPAAFMGSLRGNGEIKISNAEFSGLNPRVFEALTRVVDLGVKADPKQIREFVALLLADGHLSVPQAHSKIAFVGGQAQLVEPRVESTGAELAVSAMVDLAKANIDASLRLSGPPAGDVAGRPAVTVLLKGPISAPQRTVNAESLAGWLALRSVEQQSRRIETIEAARRAALSQPLVETAPLSFAPLVPSTQETDDATSTAPLQSPPEAEPKQAESTALAAEKAPPPLPPPIIIAPEPAPANRARAVPKRGSAARP